MTACTYNCLKNVINIGNSIIGVSILAMPYCFRKCGILLSIMLIFLNGFLTRLACYLLLKSAILARRRNFEFLAFHIFGSTGKLAVEISVIGFLIGVCIAFFVVIGDLGPPLAADFLSIENSSHLRTNVLMLVGLCVALPLGLLRNIDSLTSLSALSIAFYACLILKIFAEAVPNLAENDWWFKVNWWQSDGILPCLPIFSMALSCQTQLFEFFDTLNDPSIKRMQSVVGGAVFLCSVVYVMVGTLGYIAFHDKMISGNVLVLLTPSVVSEIIKLGFILTVAVSFPLCLFPCRSSLHSLIFKQGFSHHDLSVTPIPELRFRMLTVSLVIVTIGIAIMLPNIEFVLGIIGSTIGTLICLIFPAVMFVRDTSKNTTEKRMAQILMGIGAFILIACTYSTLQEASTSIPPNTNLNLMKITPASPVLAISSVAPEHNPVSTRVQISEESQVINKRIEEEKNKKNLVNDQKRLEPPIPQEPEVKMALQSDLDPQALQKEDKEIQKDSGLPPSQVTSKPEGVVEKDNVDKQQDILRQLEEQQKEQKKILEEQKLVLEELKHHHEVHDAEEAEEGKAKLNIVRTNKNLTQGIASNSKTEGTVNINPGYTNVKVDLKNRKNPEMQVISDQVNVNKDQNLDLKLPQNDERNVNSGNINMKKIVDNNFEVEPQTASQKPSLPKVDSGILSKKNIHLPESGKSFEVIHEKETKLEAQKTVMKNISIPGRQEQLPSPEVKMFNNIVPKDKTSVSGVKEQTDIKTDQKFKKIEMNFKVSTPLKDRTSESLIANKEIKIQKILTGAESLPQ